MYFPDNTVLINFAIIGEMELFKTLLQGRGAWVGAVHAECEESSDKGYYPGIEAAFDFMPDPILLTTFERREARHMQQYIADPTDKPTKSLGEAETIAVITNRRISPAVFITDDGGAVAYIEEQDLPIEVFSTTDILALAVNAKMLDEATAIEHIAALVAQKRKRISLNRFLAVLNRRRTERGRQEASKAS